MKQTALAEPREAFGVVPAFEVIHAPGIEELVRRAEAGLQPPAPARIAERPAPVRELYSYD